MTRSGSETLILYLELTSKLGEDLLEGLPADVGKDVEATPVGHTHHHALHAQLRRPETGSSERHHTATRVITVLAWQPALRFRIDLSGLRSTI